MLNYLNMVSSSTLKWSKWSINVKKKCVLHKKSSFSHWFSTSTHVYLPILQLWPSHTWLLAWWSTSWPLVPHGHYWSSAFPWRFQLCCREAEASHGQIRAIRHRPFGQRITECVHTHFSEARMLTGRAPHSHGLGDTRAGKTAKGLCRTEIAER